MCRWCYAGQRAALNVTGVDREEVFRGQTVVRPGIGPPPADRHPGRLLAGSGFRHSSAKSGKLMIGTSEVFAELILYDRKEWKPGEEIYASLVLREPVVAATGIGSSCGVLLRQPPSVEAKWQNLRPPSVRFTLPLQERFAKPIVGGPADES